MASYIDGFVLPIRKDKVDAYRALAQAAAVVWRDHGALSYRECVGEDLDTTFGIPFPKQLQLSPEETVVFAWIEYPSRAERDRINALVMTDPRLHCDPATMPFDPARMCCGGFETLVHA